MIKKIIPILSMPVFLFTPMVNAQLPHAPNGWYIEGSLANYINNYINNHSSYYAENPLLAGSVGYKKDRWRLEGQYLYQHINIGTCNLYYCSASNISGNKNSLELNGFYDFVNHTIFSPYVGIGVEGSNAHYNRSYEMFNNTSIYAHALFGTRAYLTDNVALDLGYKTNYSNGGLVSLGVLYHF